MSEEKKVNEVCAQCTKKCKQTDKVIVQYCPFFTQVDKD